MTTNDTFVCDYAGAGRARCPKWRCDCFIDTHPDSPHDLHPEAFTVLGPVGESRQTGGTEMSEPTMQCAGDCEDDCPDCGSLEWARMCDDCRYYATQDREPVSEPQQ